MDKAWKQKKQKSRFNGIWNYNGFDISAVLFQLSHQDNWRAV